MADATGPSRLVGVTVTVDSDADGPVIGHTITVPDSADSGLATAAVPWALRRLADHLDPQAVEMPAGDAA